MKYIILNVDGYGLNLDGYVQMTYGQEIDLEVDEVNQYIAAGAILGIQPTPVTLEDISAFIKQAKNNA